MTPLTINSTQEMEIYMKPLKLSNNAYNDSTIIPNTFIDYFMKNANDAQLKVYLFLLRALYTNGDISISHIADLFNHTEKDVIRSLEYWHKQQLIALEYNTENEIIGIALKDMPNLTETPEDSDSLEISTPSLSTESIIGNSSSPNNHIQDISEHPEILKKPTYSLKEIQTYSNEDALKELIFISESYLGRPLTPTDIHSLIFYTKDLNLSIDLIDYLLQYCVEKKKTDFRYIDKVAMNWSKEKITTPEEAMSATLKYDADTYAIMKLLGKSSSITDTELSYIKRWKTYYCFSMEIISAACSTTVLNVDKRRFIYANTILDKWFQAGVRTLEDVENYDTKFKNEQKQLHHKKKASSHSTSNNFKHNTYDYVSLEQKLLQQ